jgi:hypothetical protein
MTRFLGAVAACAAASALAACSPAVVSSPAPKSADWRAVANYLGTHRVPRVAGMSSGILVQSEVTPYACIFGTCRTWSGTVVTGPGGRTVLVSSDEGDDDLARIVFPGDLFYFPSGRNPDQASDIRIVRHGAVTLP